MLMRQGTELARIGRLTGLLTPLSIRRGTAPGCAQLKRLEVLNASGEPKEALIRKVSRPVLRSF